MTLLRFAMTATKLSLTGLLGFMRGLEMSCVGRCFTSTIFPILLIKILLIKILFIKEMLFQAAGTSESDRINLARGAFPLPEG